jgi:hypothetical protein
MRRWRQSLPYRPRTDTVALRRGIIGFPGAVLFSVWLIALTSAAITEKTMLVPEIRGDWWVVACDPDLGPFNDPKQQPVDFAVWHPQHEMRR